MSLAGSKRSHLDAVRGEIHSLLEGIDQGLDREQRQRQLEKLARSDPEAFHNMTYPRRANDYEETTILLHMINSRECRYELRTIQAVYEAWPQAGLVRYMYCGPIFNAISRRRFDVVGFLAKACPESLKERDGNSRTPLHWLLKTCWIYPIRDESNETVELLIRLCPESLTMKEYSGLTPLHYACHFYYWAAIRMLLNANPSVASCQCKRQNWTPLHVLCGRSSHSKIRQENLPTFRLLLDAARPQDESPLDLYLDNMKVQYYYNKDENFREVILKWLISFNPIISVKSCYHLWIKCDWSIRFHWIKCYVKVKHGTPHDVTDAFPLHSTFSVPPDFWKNYDHQGREVEQRFSMKDRFKVGNLTRDNLMKLNRDGLLPLHLALDVLMAMPPLQINARQFLSLLKDMVILAPKSVTIRDPRDGSYPLIRMAMLCNDGSYQSIVSNANEKLTHYELGLLFETMRSAPMGSYPNWKPMV